MSRNSEDLGRNPEDSSRNSKDLVGTRNFPVSGYGNTKNQPIPLIKVPFLFCLIVDISLIIV